MYPNFYYPNQQYMQSQFAPQSLAYPPAIPAPLNPIPPFTDLGAVSKLVGLMDMYQINPFTTERDVNNIQVYINAGISGEVLKSLLDASVHNGMIFPNKYADSYTRGEIRYSEFKMVLDLMSCLGLTQDQVFSKYQFDFAKMDRDIDKFHCVCYKNEDGFLPVLQFMILIN